MKRIKWDLWDRGTFYNSQLEGWIASKTDAETRRFNGVTHDYLYYAEKGEKFIMARTTAELEELVSQLDDPAIRRIK